MPRRSPRQHAEAAIPSISVKPAKVDWSDEDYSPSLDAHLVSALETNRRWRWGLFNPDSSPAKASKSRKQQYYLEIARALFCDHPYYKAAFQLKPGAFARAVKERVEWLPDSLTALELSSTKATRRAAAKAASKHSLTNLREARLWTEHRKRRFTAAAWDTTQWHPYLPVELQLRIIQDLIAGDPTLPIDYHTGAIISTVNSTWYAEVVRYLYPTVIVSKPCHYEALFVRHGPMFLEGPGKRTKTLRLLVPPTQDFRLCVHRTPVERVEFDFGSSRIFFDQIEPLTNLPLRALERTNNRISCLATASIPLYQLTLSLHATTLRLFVSRENALDKDDIWQDLLAGHVAALRMMSCLDHLILDAELYLVLLPGYFQAWCDNEQWQGFLMALKAEAGTTKMATFFDETPLTKLTFVGEHVPTLAFLARISRAPGVKQINLAGWNKPGIPKAWADYVQEDRKEKDPLCNWIDDMEEVSDKLF